MAKAAKRNQTVQPSNIAPQWHPPNLIVHHKKRLQEDPGCFESLLSIQHRTISKNEFELRSIRAVDEAWAEYECERRDIEKCKYYPASAYFVDSDLVVAITDTFRHNFITCYHEHFGRPHHKSPASEGARQLEYRTRVDSAERGQLIVNLERIRGV